MVEIHQLRKSFRTRTGEVPALKGVDLDIKEGEIFTMLGPSGCGKTTMLRCIAGLEKADAGKITINREVVFDAEANVVVPAHARGIGMVFQSYAIWPHMSVFQNVALPLREGTFKIQKSEVKSRVAQALSLVKLDGLMERPATLLSGGQQ
ncbi:MAG: ABC transporter ATP-binding protein, partial [Acidobacteriota bacterium]